MTDGDQFLDLNHGARKKTQFRLINATRFNIDSPNDIPELLIQHSHICILIYELNFSKLKIKVGTTHLQGYAATRFNELLLINGYRVIAFCSTQKNTGASRSWL